MKPKKRAKKVGHLTPEQMESLIVRYYAGESPSGLVAEFGLDVPPSSVVSLFPPVVHPDKPCPYCKVAMESDRPGRTSTLVKAATCPICGHTERHGCNCSVCYHTLEQQQMEAALQETESEARDKRIRLRAQVWMHVNTRLQTPVDVSALTFRQRVLLGALLCTRTPGEPTHISPMYELLLQKKVVFGPSLKFRALRELATLGAIVVDPESHDAAFIDSGENWRYDDDCVAWILNIVDSATPTREAANTLLHPGPLAETDMEAAREMWREIALAESFHYLQHKTSEYNMYYAFAEDAEKILADILCWCSTAQMYNLIDSAVRDAAALRQTNKYTRRQAFNTILGAIQQSAARHLMSGQEIKAYGRSSLCPQSVVSSFFYDRVLGIGDKGFTESPFEGDLTGML